MIKNSIQLDKLEKIYMRLIYLRTILSILATLIGISGIVLILIFPAYSVLILSIEVILLPSVYVIGNLWIEEKIKEDYNSNLDIIGKRANDLENKYIEQLFINQELKNKLKRNK